jgi:hypothetical protein
MYNKDEQIKSIVEYINSNKSKYTKEEIDYLVYIKKGIEESKSDDELLKWNCMLAMFINTKSLEELKKAQKKDQVARWVGLFLKLLAILISFYH